MSALGGLARFTPSVLDKETLEALFVHRESLVEDAVGRIRRAAASKERANRLFVGPRGAGKTHLVSLIAHRARALDGFGERVQLAWLPEDLWAIDTFDDLRKEILKCIEPSEPLDDAAEMDGGPRELVGRVRERGPVVVIVENLDQVLDDLGPDGQRKLRAAIESDRSMLLIATATRLTADLLDQDSPFYGFFDTYDLVQFDVDEAADMLKAIARQRGDEALVAELDKPQPRARLAAVAHLAGGQPRIWALFGAGLTVDGLDDLVSVLLERFDDLTPYYQEQLRRLPVNGRKAVQALAEADRALPVKVLAELTGISERSLGKTMSDLRKAGWVKVKTGPLIEMVDQRLTYYELAEPLARLAFQLKASHGEPVRLVVEFLRTWFEPATLTELHVGAAAGAYIEAAMAADRSATAAEFCRTFADNLVGKLGGDLTPDVADLLLQIDSGLVALSGGNPAPLLDLSASVSALVERRIEDIGLEALRLELLWRGVGASDRTAWSEHTEGAAATSSPPEDASWLALLGTYRLLDGRSDEGMADLEEAADRWLSRGAPSWTAAQLLLGIGSIFHDVDLVEAGDAWLVRLQQCEGEDLFRAGATSARMTLAFLREDPVGLVRLYGDGTADFETATSRVAEAVFLAFFGGLVVVAGIEDLEAAGVHDHVARLMGFDSVQLALATWKAAAKDATTDTPLAVDVERALEELTAILER